MISAAATISLAWLVLLGVAYLVSSRLGAGLGLTLAAIGLCYVALALAALVIVGFDSRGALAVAGMLVPVAAATALALLR